MFLSQKNNKKMVCKAFYSKRFSVPNYMYYEFMKTVTQEISYM